MSSSEQQTLFIGDDFALLWQVESRFDDHQLRFPVWLLSWSQRIHFHKGGIALVTLSFDIILQICEL